MKALRLRMIPSRKHLAYALSGNAFYFYQNSALVRCYFDKNNCKFYCYTGRSFMSESFKPDWHPQDLESIYERIF
jgi:hypothetical protein